MPSVVYPPKIDQLARSSHAVARTWLMTSKRYGLEILGRTDALSRLAQSPTGASQNSSTSGDRFNTEPPSMWTTACGSSRATIRAAST